MSKTYIIVALVSILICHLLTFIVGYKMQKATLLVSYLNALVAICILIFWVYNNLNIKQHYFEFREVFALCLEACILIFALYFIIGFQNNGIVKVINYIAFGLHIIAGIGMLIVISLFKINKLF